MAEATKYHILVYGSPDGYQTNRAQIALYGTAGNVISYIRFNDHACSMKQIARVLES